MENDNQKLMELPQTDVADQDMEILEHGETKNFMFTICLKPGTLMHIKIESKERLPVGNWCISAQLIHNGQHYTSTIHNYAINTELLRGLAQIHTPNIDNTNGMLPQLLMPLTVPRNLTIDINQIVEGIRSYMMDMARKIDYIMHPVSEDTNGLSTLMTHAPHTQQSLLTMLDQFERTLLSYKTIEQYHENENAKNNEVDEIDEVVDVDKSDIHSDNELSGYSDDMNAANDAGHDADDDNTDDSDVDFEKLCLSARFTPVNGYNESHFQNYTSPTASEDGDLITDDTITMEHHYDGFSHSEWSFSSSNGDDEYDNDDYDDHDDDDDDGDDENDDTLGEDSWESDFDDSATFDANMMRYLRGRASSLITRLNARWMNTASIPRRPEYWDVISCNSLGDFDDLWSILSCTTDEIDEWQRDGDRAIDTHFSQPFRRLIGEIPPETAQQARENSRCFVDICDMSPDPYHLRDNLYDEQPYRPHFPEDHPSPHEYNDDPLISESCPHLNCPHNQNDSGDCDPVVYYVFNDNSESEPETEVDSDVEMYARAMNGGITFGADQETVPLAMLVKQTDDLIAQIWATL